ncbi:class I SAM-dependent methyltransferase [Jeotgalibacillus proteolyticus]|uniref:SAM-dependent methyltransferase n=1 Tax=Jeotgalibacillus proteolyticus TaxID=2082395 RepID=A0A2S5GBY1_9BACL|nr:class I SAM-dependent methyltransferase [Jeotgalibacillus proteolyticus]PPA70425.1 SAM-dependent methyltransferase [Jeotgalibacillus proteolyticus]
MKETILNHEDLLDMLDSLLREPEGFWDSFYSDRSKGVPFFVNKPDESLAGYFNGGMLKPGKVLEMGSGPGRNAIYFAENGCEVDAIDLSEESLRWAKERADERGVRVNFIHSNLFRFQFEENTYDIVYDSGCFHHIAPHRRMNYIEMVQKALKPGGYFALTCFVEGGKWGGSDITDWEVYRQRSLNGGLGFTEEKLKTIFSDFEVIDIRRMKNADEDAPVFGVSGLWAGLFKKK